MISEADVAGAAFRHEALWYAGLEDFLDRTAPFIAEGVATEEPILVVVSAPKIAALRDRLGPAAAKVLFADMSHVGRNPAWIIPGWRDFVERYAVLGRPLRGIGEPIDTARSPAELAECERHESLLNIAFESDAPLWLVCPYDTATLPRAVLEEAERNHPSFLDGGSRTWSERYRPLEEVARPFAEPLAEPKAPTDTLEFTAGDLDGLRRLAADRAARHGLVGERAEDAVLALNEATTNSLRHGGGGGRLRIWTEGDTLVFEVRDAGAIEDPLAGRRRPRPGQIGGYGLWLASQLSDLVQVRAVPGGSVVRMLFMRSRENPALG